MMADSTGIYWLTAGGNQVVNPSSTSITRSSVLAESKVITMTKKDYELIANQFDMELYSWRSNAGPVYGQEAIKAIETLAKRLAGRLSLDDPKFKTDRFLLDCGIGSEVKEVGGFAADTLHDNQNY